MVGIGEGGLLTNWLKVGDILFLCYNQGVRQWQPQTMTATNNDSHKQWRPQTMTATNNDGHKQWRPQTMTATNNDGHKQWRPQTMTATNNDGHKQWRPQTITATKHDDQLGEIYPTMLDELNCTFGVSFSRFYSCGHHGHGLWPSWYRPLIKASERAYTMTATNHDHDGHSNENMKN